MTIASAPASELSEEELLLRETTHFMAGEVAGTLATLRIGALGKPQVLANHVRNAIRRLEAASEALQILAKEPEGYVRVDASLERLCRALGAWRSFDQATAMTLSVAPVTVTGRIARRLHLISAELISNAFRHALEAGGKELRLVLNEDQANVSLTVTDDGPGCSLERPLGSGTGLRLASELARRSGGALFCSSDNTGSRVKVRLPRA